MTVYFNLKHISMNIFYLRFGDLFLTVDNETENYVNVGIKLIHTSFLYWNSLIIANNFQ